MNTQTAQVHPADTLTLINGFAVINHAKVEGFSDPTYVILAVRPNAYAPKGYEYVTAYVDSMAASQWSTGYYTFDFDNAVYSFRRKSGNLD